MIQTDIPSEIMDEYIGFTNVLAGMMKSKEGELDPAVYLVTPGKRIAILSRFTNNVTKDLFTDFVRQKVLEFAANLTIFYSESWYLLNQKDQEDYNKGKYKSLSEFPRAREGVMVQIQTSSKDFYTGLIPILKDRKLGEPSELRKLVGYEGRFSFFL